MNAFATIDDRVRCPVPLANGPCAHFFERYRSRVKKSARSSLRARFMDHVRTAHPVLRLRAVSILADELAEGL